MASPSPASISARGASCVGASRSSSGARCRAEASQTCWRRWPARAVSASAAARALRSPASRAARRARSSVVVKGCCGAGGEDARAAAGEAATEAGPGGRGVGALMRSAGWEWGQSPIRLRSGLIRSRGTNRDPTPISRRAPFLQRAIPVAGGDVDGAHLDAVAAGVLHELAGGVEAQRLAVEHGGQEGGGLVALEPAAHVHQQRKAGGVALGEAVFAEAFDLLEDALGELCGVAALDHAADQPLVELVPRRPCASRRPWRGAGCRPRRRVKSAASMAICITCSWKIGTPRVRPSACCSAVAGVVHRLRALAPAQVGVHHAALDGAGAHDGDLDHQVVEAARLQARQHAHLRAALDLEHAHGVGGADHVVGGGVVAGDVLHAEVHAPPRAHQRQAAADGAEHAQGQHVHLQQAQRRPGRPCPTG